MKDETNLPGSVQIGGRTYLLGRHFEVGISDMIVKAIIPANGAQLDDTQGDYPIEMGISNNRSDLDGQIVEQNFVLDYLLAGPQGRSGCILLGEHPIDAYGRPALLRFRPPETIIGYPVTAQVQDDECLVRGMLYRNGPAAENALKIWTFMRDCPGNHPYRPSFEGFALAKDGQVIQKALVTNILLHHNVKNPWTWARACNELAKALGNSNVISAMDAGTGSRNAEETAPQDRGDSAAPPAKEKKINRKRLRRQMERLIEQGNNPQTVIGKVVKWLMSQYDLGDEEATQTFLDALKETQS